MNSKHTYPIEKECGYCKNKIIITASKDIRKKFCSRSCHISNNNKNRIWKEFSKNKISSSRTVSYKGINNPNYRGGGKDCVCLECSLKFKIPNHNNKNKKHSGKFCSKQCFYTNTAKNKLSVNQRKLTKIFSRNLSKLITRKKSSTESLWFNLFDYSLQDLKNHLESLFKPGMSWNNYGEWHIDHKIPISYFKFESKDDEHFKKCWSLSNLQPLWAFENLSKGGMNTKINKLKYG